MSTTTETQKKIAALSNGNVVKVIHAYYQQILVTECIILKGQTGSGREYFYAQPLNDNHPGASITKNEIIDIF